jgi:feruloyl esterase
VEGTLAPSIGFKVMLPTKTWTQRYLQLGCGGLCGNISLEAGAADGCAPLDAGGFVIAATDMGHQGMGGTFGRDAQKRTDFAYRAVHLTAVAAKRIIETFYGRPAAYSYFNGCSDGGREALVEAQRFPDDFNGIIAGAPAMNFQVQNSFYHAWQARSNTGPDGKPIVLADRLPLLHREVLRQCDALDGDTDGLIADPRVCHVKLEPLACKAGSAGERGETRDPACLSAVELEAVRRLYDGPRDARTGRRLTIGGPQPGSELAWAGVFVPRSAAEPIFSKIIALDALRNLVFDTDPPANFDLADFSFDEATFNRLRARHPLFDATNPDLSAFAKAGGKLILWHGWADPHISPLNTIAYHDAVGKFMGGSANGFERLYLLPGVYHCGDGEGPSKVDFLTPLLDWVERGAAPQAVATRPGERNRRPGGFGQPPALVKAARRGPSQDKPMPEVPRGAAADDHPPFEAFALPESPVAAGAVAMTGPRPLYPYPMVTTYDGKGNRSASSSYMPREPAPVQQPVEWAGSDFYSVYVRMVR